MHELAVTDPHSQDEGRQLARRLYRRLWHRPDTDELQVRAWAAEGRTEHEEGG